MCQRRLNSRRQTRGATQQAIQVRLRHSRCAVRVQQVAARTANLAVGTCSNGGEQASRRRDRRSSAGNGRKETQKVIAGVRMGSVRMVKAGVQEAWWVCVVGERVGGVQKGQVGWWRWETRRTGTTQVCRRLRGCLQRQAQWCRSGRCAGGEEE